MLRMAIDRRLMPFEAGCTMTFSPCTGVESDSAGTIPETDGLPNLDSRDTDRSVIHRGGFSWAWLASVSL